MILRDPHKAPRAIVNAIRQREMVRPDPNMYRATQLIAGPLARTLMIEEWEGVTLEVEDFCDVMYGTAIHKYLEPYAPKYYQVEKTFKELVGTKAGDIIVKGTCDIYDPKKKVFYDYKFWKTAAMRFQKKDVERQMNIYAWLAEESGLEVKRLKVIPLLKDWKHLESWQLANQPDYPRSRIPTFAVRLWPFDEREDYIRDRLEYHIDRAHEECSPEEKWQRPTTWAVMKKGRKSAVRVLDSEEAAKDYIREKKLSGGITITKRTGECIKCKHYCFARSVCPFRKGK